MDTSLRSPHVRQTHRVGAAHAFPVVGPSQRPAAPHLTAEGRERRESAAGDHQPPSPTPLKSSQSVSQELSSSSSSRDVGMKSRPLRPWASRNRIPGGQSPQAVPQPPGRWEPESKAPRGCILQRAQICAERALLGDPGASVPIPTLCSVTFPKPLDLSGPLVTQMLNDKVSQRPVT